MSSSTRVSVYVTFGIAVAGWPVQTFAEQPANNYQCYHLKSEPGGDPREGELLELLCKASRRLIEEGKSGIIYEQLKHRKSCDFLKVSDFFSLKPAENWETQDFADAVRIKSECRRALKVTDEFDPPGSLSSIAVYDTFHSLAIPAVQARERRKAIVAAEAAEQERRKTAEDHVAALAEEGYKAVTVSDIQLSGRAMIGERVVVKGYVTLFSDREARIYTHRDDANGVLLSVEQGPLETRRFILENCSRLSRFCRMEIKATVAQVDGETTLIMPSDELRSGE